MERAGAIPVAIPAPGRHDRPMSFNPAADRLWIEIDLTAEPIAGAIHHGNASVRRFSGWLELVALLETLRQPDGTSIAQREQR